MRFPVLSRLFLFFGALLFLIGMFVRMLFAEWDASSLFYVFTGLFCIAGAVALDIKGFYMMFQPRSIRRGLKAFGGFVVTVILVVGLNYFLADYPQKMDFSPQKSHTLTPFSKKIAKSFSDTVEMIYLQVPDADSKYTDEKVFEAVKKYQDENPKIRYTKYNVMDHPELVEKYRLQEREQAMFFIYKDHFERFYKTDEESMTKALLRLLKGRKTIYFSIGNGEGKTDSKSQRGLASLRAEIERLFYDVAEINLENEMIPKDSAGLAVIGPSRALSARSSQKILDYLKSGGRVYLAFDPVQDPDSGGFLKNFGLRFEKGVVHQEENAMANVGSFVVSGFVPKEADHKLLENLRDATDEANSSPVIFYVTGALVPFAESQDYKITELIKSVPTAVLRTGYSKQDKFIGKGYYNLLVAAKNANGGEVVISADSDLFGNQFLYQHANPTLMFNLFSYLSTDEDLIEMKPELGTASRDFFVTDVMFKLYLGFFILGLPVLFFSMGGFIWARRRWM